MSVSNRNLAEILSSITMQMQSEGVYKVIFEWRRGIWNLGVINAEIFERTDWRLVAHLHQTERGFEKQQVH